MNRRPSARQRGYDTAWDKARLGYLRLHPWCAMCARHGQQVRATVVDHIRPHRGDQRLFWDKTNWQGLCDPHHDSAKQRQERGSAQPIGLDGRPLDPAHPWNRRSGD
jgi:5-methylcytosine-specific restriction endonuclease McrA